MTNRDEIRSWLEGQFANEPIGNFSHMLVVCDTFDHEDYPVYVKRTKDVRDIIKEYEGKSMQKIMEVYNFDMDIEEQLKVGLVWNVDVKTNQDNIPDIYNVDMENLINSSIDVGEIMDGWEKKGYNIRMNTILEVEDMVRVYKKKKPFASDDEIRAYVFGYYEGFTNGMGEAVDYFEEIIGEEV